MVQRAIFIDGERIFTTPLEFALFVTFYRRRSVLTRKKIERGELRKKLHAVFAKIGLTDHRYTLADWTGKTAMTRFMQTVAKLNQKLPLACQIRNLKKEDYGKAKYALNYRLTHDER